MHHTTLSTLSAIDDCADDVFSSYDDDYYYYFYDIVHSAEVKRMDSGFPRQMGRADYKTLQYTDVFDSTVGASKKGEIEADGCIRFDYTQQPEIKTHKALAPAIIQTGNYHAKKGNRRYEWVCI